MSSFITITNYKPWFKTSQFILVTLFLAVGFFPSTTDRDRGFFYIINYFLFYSHALLQTLTFMCFKSIFSNFTQSVATPYTKPHMYKELSVKSVPKAQNQELCSA